MRFSPAVILAFAASLCPVLAAAQTAADNRGSAGNAPQETQGLERAGLRGGASLIEALSEIPQSAPCPSTWAPIQSLPGAILGCTCTAEQITGSVWGSGPYTFDSALCAAARHAGAIGAEGGPIWITVGPAYDAYAGTTANEITTLGYGAYGPSGIILSAPGGRGQEPVQIAACPSSMTGLEEAITCHCAPASFGGGGVWGTGLYTHDSHLCTAALHAGFVSEDGGPVTAEPQPDAGSYLGSTRNGVSPNDYGSYNGAFRLIKQ